MNKPIQSPQDILDKLDEQREIVRKYIELQKSLNATDGDIIKVEHSPRVYKKSKNAPIEKRTGLKPAMIEYLRSTSEYKESNEVAEAIKSKFPDVDFNRLKANVANAFTKDKDLASPAFINKPRGNSPRLVIWSVKK